MPKPKIFYCTGESRADVLSSMETVDQNKTQIDAERGLKKMERDDEDGDQAYWRRVKIFKVTVEEIPRTANAKPEAEPSPPDGQRS
jgi:hypothetical protein